MNKSISLTGLSLGEQYNQY